MRISTLTEPQALLTVGDEKKGEAKAVDSKNIFKLEPYLESIQKNTATSIDLSGQKDPGFKSQKIITIRDPGFRVRNESTFFKEKLTYIEDTDKDYDSSEGSRIRYPDGGGAKNLTLMPDGRLATLSSIQVIRVWDTKTGDCIKSLDLRRISEKILYDQVPYYTLAALSNGYLATTTLVSASDQRDYLFHSGDKKILKKWTIDIWDVYGGKLITQLKKKNCIPGATNLTGLPNEQLLVLLIDGYEIWDLKKQKIIYEGKRLFPSPRFSWKAPEFGGYTNWALNYDGTRVAGVQVLPDKRIISCQGQAIDLWDPLKKSYQDIKENPDVIDVASMCLAVLHDGRIALSRYVNKKRKFYGNRRRYYDSFDEAVCESYTKSDTFTLIGIYDNNKNYVHTQSIGPIAVDGKGVISSLVALRNGYLASACDGVIQIWDIAKGTCINTLEGHSKNQTIQLIELPDGRIASGGTDRGLQKENSDRTLRFWESGGPLQLSTIEPLLTALKTNTSVTYLNLQNTAVDDNIVPFIVELWKTNYTLKKIDLRNTAVTVGGLRRLLQFTQPSVGSSVPTTGTFLDRKQDNSGLLELIQHPSIEIIRAEKREAEIKAKAKAEADERARQEAELKAKADAEAAEKARKEAEIKAKMEAAERAYKEEQAKIKAQAEAAEKLRKEQELKAQQEAEEKRRQAEKQKQLQELHKKGEQGDITAQLDLAGRYEKGNDVVKDSQQVLYWYKKAAEQGNDIAQQKLGEIFEKGLAGKKDYAQAYFWYQKAADQGNDGACAGLKSLKEKGYNPAPSAEFKAASIPDKSKDDKDLDASFEIVYDQLTIGKELGRGGFGVVYQGTWRFNNVAIKQLLTKSLSAEALEEFNSESRIMAKLRSDYIVQFRGICVSPTYCLVMEYMPKGSLFNLLRSSEPLDWSVRNRMITEIASGLAFLHASNIFHRDLKSLNVLLDEHYRTKLCDFGLSKVKKENQSIATLGGPVGTIPWMAPELFERRATFTAKADIYSLAMTLWEIASRKTPFADASSASLIPMWVTQGQREEIPSDTPLKISSLIRCCWHQDPTKRPTAAEVVTYLRSDQVEFKSTETALSSPVTTSIQGNLVSSASSDLGSSSIRANLMSGSI